MYPYAQGRLTASTINFQADTIAVANGVLVPVCDPTTVTCDYDLSLNKANRLGVDLIIDVTGYLAVPAP